MARSEKSSTRRTEVSERRYRRLFESAHDGILILDANSGEIVDANPYLLELLGYDPGELLGKQPWEIGIFADIEANKAALRELQEKGAIRYEDLPLQTKNREQQIDVEFVSNVYQEGDQAVIQCNIRDIRARKAAAVTARGEADRLKRTKDEFFAIVAHELRGPLQVVSAWTAILQRMQADPKEFKECLDIIMRSVQAESRIIEDLLDISRIDFGKLSCHLKPVDVVPAVAAAVENARPTANAKRIQLRWTNDFGGKSVVNGDAGRLQQVFGNILSNALKFTPVNGTVEVTVRAYGAEVEVQIKDSGIGISPTVLPHIFDRFQQAEPLAGKRHGGLGLGLAIAKELVMLHNGQVTAESEGDGKGATIRVRLPLANFER